MSLDFAPQSNVPIGYATLFRKFAMSDFTSSFFVCLTKLTLFSLLLSLGLTINLKQVVFLWQKPGLLNRAIWGISVINANSGDRDWI